MFTREPPRGEITLLVGPPEADDPEDLDGRLRAALATQTVKDAAALVSTFPDDPTMRVSHETIYRTLFVQGRGALRKELTVCLRSGRAQRRPRLRLERSGAGRLRDVVLISERLWTGEFSSDPKVIGRSLVINGADFTVVGVLPNDFRFLNPSGRIRRCKR